MKMFSSVDEEETHTATEELQIRDVTSNENLLSLIGMNLRPRQGLSRFILIGLMVIDGSSR